MADFQIIKTGITNTDQAPRGEDIFYKCENCGSYVSSTPENSTRCRCANIRIDVDYIRLLVEDFSKFVVVRQVVE